MGGKLLAAFERVQPYSEQIAHYRHVLRRYREDADAHYNLGVLYGRLGYPEAAAEQYRRALAINPADLSARNNLANNLLNRGQAEAAIGEYERVLTLSPHNARAYNNLGTAYMELRDLEMATQILHKAARADSAYADPHYNLSQIYFMQGRRAEAEAELAIYEKLRP